MPPAQGKLGESSVRGLATAAEENLTEIVNALDTIEGAFHGPRPQEVEAGRDARPGLQGQLERIRSATNNVRERLFNLASVI